MVALVLVAIILATFTDFGITWDEEVQRRYGEAVVRYYTSFFADRTALSSSKNLCLYGGLFEALATIISKVLPWGIYESRHLLTALVGVLGLLGCSITARFLAGPRAGLWALVLMSVSVAYVGHLFVNSKDIPFATAYVWSLYYVLRASREFPNVSGRVVVMLGLTTGCALGIRVGGLLLLAYWGGMLLVGLAWQRWHAPGSFRTVLANNCQKAALATVIAWLLMCLSWPWAQRNPVVRPLQALILMTHSQWIGPVLFNGKTFLSNALPVSYLPVHLAIKLPELTVLGLVIGATITMWTLQRPHFARQRIELGFLTVAAAFPILYAIVRHSTLYDEMRHFLFVVPPLTVLAAVAWTRTTEFLATQRPRIRTLAGAGLASYVAFQIGVAVVLHPYEYVYYNQLVGGLPGAAGSYETDYWCSSYKDATSQLVTGLRRELGETFDRVVFSVYVCGPVHVAAHYLPTNMRASDSPRDADFQIAYGRQLFCDRSRPGDVVTTVSRMGVDLSVVKALR